MERPWNTLYSKILGLLINQPVLQSWEKRTWKAPRRLRQLPSYMLHDAAPILKDLNDEAYLAPEYGSMRSRVLNDLGTTTMTASEIVDRIQADLVTRLPRLKSTSPGNPWHVSFAKLGLQLLVRSDPITWQRFRRLAIIPLVGGVQWTGAPGVQGGLRKIYFPTTDNIPIPTSLSIHLVDPVAASSAERRRLYEALVVEVCPTDLVLSEIKVRHQSQFRQRKIPEEPTYLFHFHPDPNRIRDWVLVDTNEGQNVTASAYNVYFPSTAEYDFYQLLPEYVKRSPSEYGLSEVRFLSQSLVELEQLPVNSQNMDRKSWLACITNARYHPPLSSRSGASRDVKLSSSIKAILEHNPQKFLGVLKAHWSEYQHEAELVKLELMGCQVLCTSGEYAELSSTYLLTPKIRSRIAELHLHDVNLVMLSLPGDALTESTWRQWEFLERFQVSLEPNIQFYKDLLLYMFRNMEQSVAEDVYTSIAELTRGQDHESVRYAIQ